MAWRTITDIGNVKVLYEDDPDKGVDGARIGLQVNDNGHVVTAYLHNHDADLIGSMLTIARRRVEII